MVVGQHVAVRYHHAAAAALQYLTAGVVVVIASAVAVAKSEAIIAVAVGGVVVDAYDAAAYLFNSLREGAGDDGGVFGKRDGFRPRGAVMLNQSDRGDDHQHKRQRRRGKCVEILSGTIVVTLHVVSLLTTRLL